MKQCACCSIPLMDKKEQDRHVCHACFALEANISLDLQVLIQEEQRMQNLLLGFQKFDLGTIPF